MGYGQHGVSLLDGWLPITVQIIAVVLLLAALARRDRRWWIIWVPAAVVVGVIAVLLASWYERAQGLASDPPPAMLWWWIGILGFALGIFVFGVIRTRWWRRVVALLAVVAALASAGLVLNQWVGYYTTVPEAWGALTQGPLPNEVDASQLASLRGKPTTTGKIVALDTPKGPSGFSHRTEYVYLPPQWFAGASAPQLPAVLMIAGEFNTPEDWLRIGNAAGIADHYAAQHGGKAPILVFPDVGGSFNNDTECVNGPRGNVASHLTDEVRPAVIDQFHAAPAGKNWGVVGWSMGGTCALDLVVMHPDKFSAFDDIAGDAAPDAGDKQQSVARLFGGSTAEYDRFDPTKVMAAHGPYSGIVGWFDDANPGTDKRAHHWHGHRPSGGTGLGGRDNQGFTQPGAELAAARQLCVQAQTVGIECTVRTRDGGHTWQFAQAAFTEVLGPMSQRIGL